jgi:hypothetical protein
LKIDLFEQFFTRLVDLFYQLAPIKRYKGFRIWACDGSIVRLADQKDAHRLGTHTTQHGTFASVRLLCYCDVFNKLITRYWLKDKQSQEISQVCPYLADLPKDVLSVYDRLYASHRMLFLHQFHHSHCLIRCKTTGSNTIQAFLDAGQSDALITEPLNERAWRQLRKLGHQKSSYHTLTYRLIRVELPSGETEVLMTTLLEGFTVADFSYLYQQRWGIETVFDQVKNLLKAGVFSGYSAHSCQQDLWALPIVFNLQTVLMLAGEPALKKRCRKRAKAYQINRNVGLDSLKRNLNAVLLANSRSLEKTLDWLLERFLQNLERIKDPVEPMARKAQKSLRANERHWTEYNYKPAV